MRRFLELNYNDLKHLNPGLPMLVRDGDDMPTIMIAQYGEGSRLIRRAVQALTLRFC